MIELFCSRFYFVMCSNSSLCSTGTDEIDYQLVAKQEAHKRIIWSCSWNPFGHEFATGSRDKTVKIWAVGTETSVKLLLTLPPFKSSVTALSWLSLDNHSNRGLLAVGMENGLIELWNLNSRGGDGHLSVQNASPAVKFDPFLCHVSTVQRLSWRNPQKSEDSETVQLASCGADHCVRIFRVTVT